MTSIGTGIAIELAPTTALRYRGLTDIVGDIARVRTGTVGGAALGELALVEQGPDWRSLAIVVEVEGDSVSLQLFAGALGLSTAASVRFLGRPMSVVCSDNILGRQFRGDGEPRDNGPRLIGEPRIEIGGPPVNPFARALPTRMIRTGIPMIDMFNCLVQSQKLPIFAVAGEPYNALLANVGLQSDADLIVFGGLGLLYDDYHFFRATLEESGVADRAVMIVNLAGESLVERLLVPDLALAVAERFGVDQNKRVLVLLTDMTAYADALKEVGIALERIPANRGYTGDLYTQLARRYEKACDFIAGGSVTILTATTLPGDDITHPVPDNTGYITEGQLYLRDGMLDPFGSLSRLKQHVIGTQTRDDHRELADAMIRLFAQAEDAERKRAMAFDLSPFDERLLAYRILFRDNFMRIDRTMPLEDALDLGWSVLSRCFEPAELPIKDSLLAVHYRRPEAAERA